MSRLLLCLASTGCNTAANGEPERDRAPKPNAVVPKYGYQIVNIWPHDSNAFTQGLILVDGKLLESTGQEGRFEPAQRRARNRENPEKGRRSRTLLCGRHRCAERKSVPTHLAAPSWASSTICRRLERVGEFNYQGEGWGLTTDGQSLIMSDGSTGSGFSIRRVFESQKPSM